MLTTEIINVKKLKKAANVIRALNHQLRQELLRFISSNEPVMVSEIYKTLDIEQSVCSQHLSILRQSNIVQSKRKGRKKLYYVDHDRLSHIMKSIKSL